ncbi:major facilitator transporter [Ramaria rubella]|nr:major facilitator transporter [Ramaria rubella]
MESADHFLRKPLLAGDGDIVEDIEDSWPEGEGIVGTGVKRSPLPKQQLSVLLYMSWAEPMTTHVMGPFIVQLIQETGITGGDITKVGYYTGLVDSLYYLAEAFTVLQWGRLSDRIGRKRVLLIGLFCFTGSMFLFGLSHTFWLVILSRVIGGFFNGNSVVSKSVLGEITDETNAAQAFASLTLTWAIGNTLAPLIGGSLQHPYERIGGVFLTGFWRRNPYFLPCLASAFVSASGFVLGLCLLRETAPGRQKRFLKEDRPGNTYRNAPLTITERSPMIPSHELAPAPPLLSLLTPRVLIVILNYSVMGALEVAFAILQPLVLSTPIEHGGLGMKPSTIGVCMAAFGIANGTVSVLFFAPLVRIFGMRTVSTTCAAASGGCFILFPVMNAIARIEGRVTPLVWLVFVAQLTLATLPPMVFSSIFIYLTHAAPTRSALGATNGLAQTIASIVRSLGPASTTALFALSIKHNLLGGNMVYSVLCLFSLVATMTTRLLPIKPWDKIKE